MSNMKNKKIPHCRNSSKRQIVHCRNSSKRQIVHCRNSSKRQIVERDKINTPYIHIHDRSFPWIGTGISIQYSKLN